MGTFLGQRKLPYWLKKTVREGLEFKETKKVLAGLRLNTVCQSALCPNIFDCFSQKRTTFLILGNHCTRNCGFCAVPVKDNDILKKPNPEEPLRIKKAVEELGLSHLVITSVTRDDLEDGGAGHFANCIKILKELPGIIVEVLLPDFKGDLGSIKMVVDAGPDIFSHNIETVPRLYPEVRPQADYQRSLQVLSYANFFREKKRFFQNSFRKHFFLKSGLMVGLGEREEEVIEVMEDLRRVGCDIITIGQYLRPTQANIEVSEFIEPAQFVRYSEIAKELGFREVACGPFVRSSYYVSNSTGHPSIADVAAGLVPASSEATTRVAATSLLHPQGRGVQLQGLM